MIESIDRAYKADRHQQVQSVHESREDSLKGVDADYSRGLAFFRAVAVTYRTSTIRMRYRRQKLDMQLGGVRFAMRREEHL